MMRHTIFAALLMGAVVASPVLTPAAAVAANPPIEINWGDLIPETAQQGPIAKMEDLFGLTEDDRAIETPGNVLEEGGLSEAPSRAQVVTAYNGKRVTLSGFVIPLDYSADGITSFMLVPFVGACIHVPPPPPNQLVYVTVDEPFMVAGLFAPFTVTGELGTTLTRTELADVGYSMKADTVAPYE